MKGQGIDDVTNGWHPDERHWLEEFRNTLRAAYGNAVEKALLFGSRARGDWRTDSDIDVMVIVKEEAAGTQERIADMAIELVFDAEYWKAVPCVLTSTASEWTEGPIQRVSACYERRPPAAGPPSAAAPKAAVSRTRGTGPAAVKERITLSTSIEPHDLPGRCRVPSRHGGTKVSSPSGRNGSVRPRSALT